MDEQSISDQILIGSRIRDIRKQKGLSQAELAEKSHISSQQISSIELGKAKMRLETFVSITEALQVSADAILRSDVPSVKAIYNSEISELLSDCTAKEIDAIMRVLKEIKGTLRTK